MPQKIVLYYFFWKGLLKRNIFMTTYNFLKPFHQRLNASFYLTYLIQFFTFYVTGFNFLSATFIFKLQMVVEFYVGSKPLIRLLLATPCSASWAPVLLSFTLATVTNGRRVKVRSFQSLWVWMNSGLLQGRAKAWNLSMATNAGTC